MKDFLSRLFDQRGGTWIGLATCSVILQAWLEFVTSGFSRPLLVDGRPVVLDNVVATLPGWHPQTPPWWVVGAAAIYVVILGFFVVSKGGTYFIDSRWNSEQGKRPEPKEEGGGT